MKCAVYDLEVMGLNTSPVAVGVHSLSVYVGLKSINVLTSTLLFGEK